MKLKTSYCKLTTFKKDLTRFAPVWALYLIAMLLVLTELGGYSTYDRFAWSAMNDLVMSFGVVNICYAGVVAQVLFGDLYNTRMCYSLHTQPARRESLFLSHFAAALCFSLVPNMVATAFLMWQLEKYWVMGLWWLLASELQFVFFFGLAAVSAMCAGNRLGMIAVYAVLNFFSMIAYWVVNTIYLPQLPGVVLNMDGYTRLSPVVELFRFDFFRFEREEIYNWDNWQNETFYKYLGLGDGWGYLAIMGVIGLTMTALAVWLYRKRHLESAGDLVAFRKLSPVVGVVLTVCVAVAFAFFGEALGSGYLLFLVVGLIVGWFGSRMLIERRVRVFYGKSFLGLGILAAVLLVSFLTISGDVFNIVGYLPEVEKVESVTISNYRASNYDGWMEDYYYDNRISVTLEKQEEIQEIIDAHEDILDRMDDSSDSRHRVTIRYRLNSGRTVVRSYTAPAYGENYEIFRKYFYTPQQILGYTDWDEYVENMEHIQVDGNPVNPQHFEELLLALKTDCEAGTVSIGGQLKEVKHWVSLRWETPDGYGNYYRELAVSGNAVNTIALLKTPKIALGFEELSEVQFMDYVLINGMSVEEAEMQGLMEAVLKDYEEGTIGLDRNGEATEYYLEYCFRVDGTGCYRYLDIGKYAQHTRAWIQEEWKK